MPASADRLRSSLESPARQGDKRHVASMRMLAHPLGKLVTVHAGHPDIEQHHGRPELVQRFERRAAVVRRSGFEAEQRQQDAEAVGRVAVVVDDDDSASKACASPAAGDAGAAVAAAASGSRTTNSLPRPVPRCAPRRVPPCSSTRLRTSVSPMPEAAVRAVERAVDLREQVEHARQHIGRDADARCRAR